MSAIVPKEEQEIILKMLNGLPPEQLLGNLTEDQKDHWYKVKYIFQLTYIQLKSFFLNIPSPLQELLGDEGDEKKTKEICGCLTDFYMSLYAMIQWGWKDILNYYAQFGHKHVYGEQFPCTSPGETLAAILERDAAAQFWQCKQGRLDFKPREIYKLHLQRKKKAKGKLSPQAIKQYEKKALALAKPFDSLRDLEILCLEACYKGAKERRDKNLLTKIEDVETKNNNLSDTLNRYYRDMKGHAWQGGEKLETVKEGGTYKSSSS